VFSARDAVTVGVVRLEEAVWDGSEVCEASLKGGVAAGLWGLASATPVFQFLFSETGFDLSLDKCSSSALAFLQFTARKESSAAVHLEI
jgi:hypothetical protein